MQADEARTRGRAGAEATATPRTREGWRGRGGRWAVAGVVSFGLLAWLVAQLDEGNLSARLATAGWEWLALAAASSCGVLLCRGLRFWALIPGAGAPLTTAAVAIQVFLNRVTPFRLGEISLPLLLARHGGVDLASSLVDLLFVRLLDLTLVLCAIGLSLGLRHGSEGWVWLAVCALALSLLTFRTWLGAASRLAHRIAARLGWTRFHEVDRILGKLVAASTAAKALGAKRRLVVGATSLGVFVFQAGVFGCVLLAFGVEVPWVDLARGAAVAQAGAAVPVAAVGTFGTQEAAWVAGFSWVGVSLEDAIVTGIAAQLLTLAFSAAFALPAWLWLGRRPAPPR